jgi:hypothetical protein
MVNLEGIIWELSLDGLHHLEQAMLEEAPIEARNNPASYVLDFKPKQAAVREVQSHADKEFVAEQLTSRRQIKPRADWD